MDYTKIPRSLIYEDLNDLIYFEVKTPETINAELFFILKKELLRYTTEAKKYALECFNNAYYICTLVLLEEYPELLARKYQNNVLIKTQGERPDYDICAASMGLAYHLLSRCDDPKCSNKELLDNIYLSFKTGEFTSLQARNTFFNIVDKYDVSQYSVPSSLFAPRKIIRAVAHATEKDLVHGKEYIYERSCLFNDIRSEDYLLEYIIMHLKEELHKIYDDYEYDENEKFFCDELTNEEYEKFNNAVTPIIEAIKYYENCISFNHIGLDDTEKNSSRRVSNVKQSEVSHKSPENETLQERIKVLNLEVSSLKSKLREANHTIEELTQPVEELTAKDKIRMAFTLQLLKEAGLTDETIKVRGNGAKVARIMSFLLEIISKNNRGNSAQICQTFLSDSGKYYPQNQDNNTLIELNNLCFELGINVCLSIESQSNNKR